MKVKDLFCGMAVDPKNAPAKVEFEGTMYDFCDNACKQMFMFDPQKYIRLDKGQNKQ